MDKPVSIGRHPQTKRSSQCFVAHQHGDDRFRIWSGDTLLCKSCSDTTRFTAVSCIRRISMSDEVHGCRIDPLKTIWNVSMIAKALWEEGVEASRGVCMTYTWLSSKARVIRQRLRTIWSAVTGCDKNSLTDSQICRTAADIADYTQTSRCISTKRLRRLAYQHQGPT